MRLSTAQAEQGAWARESPASSEAWSGLTVPTHGPRAGLPPGSLPALRLRQLGVAPWGGLTKIVRPRTQTSVEGGMEGQGFQGSERPHSGELGKQKHSLSFGFIGTISGLSTAAF